MKPDVLALTVGVVVIVAGLVRANRAGPDVEKSERRVNRGIVIVGVVVLVIGAVLLLT
ncbi:hypothetical protein GCM10025783_29760 [Amnibacterium soli]|uniref:Uncharacterized protein n=1 Tax=Amnibacterium soli TaxID=1282736 RepID=A0ABP8ZEY0_9MICO